MPPEARECRLEGRLVRGLTFELTGPLRRDGLARAGKMYRVPQTGQRPRRSGSGGSARG